MLKPFWLKQPFWLKAGLQLGLVSSPLPDADGAVTCSSMSVTRMMVGGFSRFRLLPVRRRVELRLLPHVHLWAWFDIVEYVLSFLFVAPLFGLLMIDYMWPLRCFTVDVEFGLAYSIFVVEYVFGVLVVGGAGDGTSFFIFLLYVSIV